MRSTSSLAAWHQWSKFPVLTQDFTIRAWFSTKANALSISSTNPLLAKSGEEILNGSVELPSSQNMMFLVIKTIAHLQGGASESHKKSVEKTNTLISHNCIEPRSIVKYRDTCSIVIW